MKTKITIETQQVNERRKEEKVAGRLASPEPLSVNIKVTRS